MKTSRWIKTVLSVVVLALFAVTAQAQYYYGSYATKVADTVTYSDIWEENFEGRVLFDDPSVTAGSNGLDFDPKGFGVNVSGGDTYQIDGTLHLQIDSHEGEFIDTVQFTERGDYNLSGIGTTDTYTQVGASFIIEVLELDHGNTALTGPIVDTFFMTFDPNANGLFDLVNDGTGLKEWSGQINIDIDALLASNNVSPLVQATSVEVTLDNNIYGQSENGTTAFLKKKDFDALSVTVIPEPASAVLLMGTSSLIVLIRRWFIA